ncbi:MAG: DUF6498-containing protein [Usitatibacter sp.]
MANTWPIVLLRLLVLLGLNFVPIWGFAEESWSPGTTLALYWVQSAFSIPITAVLIFMHRRATHKWGHYNATTTISVNGGPAVTKPSTFLDGFLWMSVPFLVAHGIFLAVLLGLIWKDAAGAVDYEDLRTGAVAMLNIMALAFALDTFRLAQRPFAWIRHRAMTQMQRVLVVHLTIVLGMGAAALSQHDAAFFGVFLALKLLVDFAGELPQRVPKEPPRWIRWVYKRAGEEGDIQTEWKRMRAEEKESLAADERVIERGFP